MNGDLILNLGVIGFVFLLFNGIFLAVIFAAQKDANAMKNWPTVQGNILMSTLESRRTSNGHHVQYPVVLYAYQVGGRSYQGSRIAPGPQVGGSGAPKTMAKYESGSQVAVHYNPGNPSDAALEVKSAALGWLWFALILVDVVLGLVALFNLFF